MQDLTRPVQRLHTDLTDLASLYWEDCERTDSNAARAKATAVSELAADPLTITGVTEQACVSDLLGEMRATAETIEET